jgi:hypothetical protein
MNADIRLSGLGRRLGKPQTVRAENLDHHGSLECGSGPLNGHRGSDSRTCGRLEDPNTQIR